MHYIFILLNIVTDSVNFFDSDTVQITCQPAANYTKVKFSYTELRKMRWKCISAHS